MSICPARTAALDEQLRARNGITPLSGPLPHVYGSRKRHLVDGEWTDWTHPKCSWCGKEKP